MVIAHLHGSVAQRARRMRSAPDETIIARFS
jgi:hypothetical protein